MLNLITLVYLLLNKYPVLQLAENFHSFWPKCGFTFGFNDKNLSAYDSAETEKQCKYQHYLV